MQAGTIEQPDDEAAQLLATRHPWVADWPFIAPGVCATYLGNHFLMLIGDGVDGRSFDAYMAALERATAGAPDDFRGGTVFHVTSSQWWESLPVGEKIARLKRFGDMTTRHAAKLRKNVPVGATIAASTLARVVIRTLNTLHTPVIPTSVVASAEEAWLVIKRLFPELNVRACLAAHAELVARHVPSLAGSVSRARSRSGAPRQNQS